jgi:hypothetical protein
MKTKKLLIASAVMLLFSISITIFNLSCNKPADAQPQSQTNCMGPQPKFQFKANGKLYVCDPVFDKRIGWTMVNNYEGTGATDGYTPDLHIGSDYSILGGGYLSPSFVETYINLKLSTTSTPTVGTYNENNIESDCSFSEIDNNGFYNRSTHTITFTRVSNGTVDGTFSGTVRTTNTTPVKTVTITEGVFSNIPIF